MDDVRNISYLDLVEYDGESADHDHYRIYGRWRGTLEFTRSPALLEATALRCWSPDPPEVLRNNRNDLTRVHVLRLGFRRLLLPRSITSLKGLWFYAHLMGVDPPNLLAGYTVTFHKQLGLSRNGETGQCTLLTSVYLTALRTTGGPQLIGVRG